MSDADRRRTPPWLELEPGEKLWLSAAPSKNLLLAGVGAGFTMLIVGSVIVGAVGNILTGRLISVVMLAVIVGLLAGLYALTERGEYAMTSDRVVARSVLPWRSYRAVPLTRVEEVTIEQSAWERWIQVGGVLFETDGQEPDVRFSFVEDPHFVFERATEGLTSTPERTPRS